jgi:flavin reductase
MERESVAPEQFKAAMGSFAAGVTIVTTLDGEGVAHALTATAFSAVSLSPPLCLVCVDKRARTRQPLLMRRHFAINMLDAQQQDLSARFASSIPDKFAGVSWWGGELTGCPILEGALTWLECQVVEVHSGGDHDIFIGRVLSVQVHDGTPLVYWRGRYSSLPPAPPKLAPDDRTGHVTT